MTKDINYMPRQMNHFWHAMLMNLERLGVQLGCEEVDKSLPIALQGAQEDFLMCSLSIRGCSRCGSGRRA